MLKEEQQSVTGRMSGASETESIRSHIEYGTA